MFSLSESELQYIEGLRKVPRLSQEEEISLVARILQGDFDAKRHYVEANLFPVLEEAIFNEVSADDSTVSKNNVFTDGHFMISLGLPLNLYERLLKNGVTTWEQFIDLTEEKILSFPGFGGKTVSQIMPVVKAAKNGDDDTIKNAVEYFVLNRFDNLSGLSRKEGENEIRIRLPYSLISSRGTAQIFDMLLNDGKITEFEEGQYRRTWMTVKQALIAISDKYAAAFIEYLSSEQTMDELAKTKGCTKQHLSNKFKIIKDNMPKVYEDYIFELYKKYDFPLSALNFIFNVDNIGEKYLKIYKFSKKGNDSFENDEPIYETGKFPYMDILKVDYIPRSIKLKIEEYSLLEKIKIEDTYVPKTKSAIFRELIIKHCQESLSIDKFLVIYEEFMKSHGLEDLQYSIGSLKGEIQDRYHGVLYNSSNSSIRAYDVDAVDMPELLAEIKFNDLTDVELTANFFFDGYPDLMKELDIRNGYELHNLLKKRKNDIPRSDWGGKMPTIIFGKGDKRRQIIELLFQEAPISKDDFITEYEKRYGKQGEGFYPNDVNPAIGEHLKDGEYSVDVEPLQTLEIQLLKPHFTEKFYTIDDACEIFHAVLNKDGKFSDEDIKKRINGHNMNQLGYKLRSSGAAFSLKYNTFDDAVRAYFLDEGTVVWNSLGSIRSNSTFNATFNKMRHDYDIVETAPGTYTHITELDRQGITKDGILAFCQSLNDKISDKYFTVENMLRNGITLSEQNLQLSNESFKSVIRFNPLISSFYLGKNYVFRRKNELATPTDFLFGILSEKQSVTTTQFINILKEEYGVELDKYKIKKYLEETTAYYSYRLDTFFSSYNKYQC